MPQPIRSFATLHWRAMRILALAMAALLLTRAASASACSDPVSVCDQAVPGGVALIVDGTPATVLVDRDADPAVIHVAKSLAQDFGRVGGKDAKVRQDAGKANGPVILIGEIGRSALLKDLTDRGLINVADLAGQWEGFRQIVLDNPWPGVPRALVIAGSDRRGAVYGAYDLSERMGVSPWYWFADVPVAHRSTLFLAPGSRGDRPAVKYRGFFINDEAPAFSSWTMEKFGGANSKAYEHIFELLLRLKGNYLWPAMWAPRAFNDDDPKNKVLADAMGVVMGTSHHEPLTRAQDEWHRNTGQGITGGKWDYATNAVNLQAFWRGGVERMMSKGDGKGYDSLLTVGMRGDGDEAMSEGTAIGLLEQVVADQRKIIADVTGKPADQTPQVWALYKEVQDYYDHGMRVPDDVTLLFADDNWGQIRRLPALGAPERKGGYGVYYHFDYVGAPRNYKWLDTVQIEKTWQQMDLAWQRGAKTIWIVNVGDIKPEEFPLSFFMAHAWAGPKMDMAAMGRFPQEWAAETFGSAVADEIGAIQTRYGQLAAMRKPELLDATSFDLGDGVGAELDGGPFGALVAEWDALEARTMAVKQRLPENALPAYFELVEHKVRALANLYRLYYAVAWNHRLADFRDARANVFADRAEAAFAEDQRLTDTYHALLGGKWDGMMSQTHIGYTIWQQPEEQVMPAVKRVTVDSPVAEVRFAAPTVEQPGVIRIEAAAFVGTSDGSLRWTLIPHLGSGKGAVTAFPQGRRRTTPADDVRIDYAVSLAKSGDLEIALSLIPTLDPDGTNRLRIGVSLDDGPVQILTDSLIPAPNDASSIPQHRWDHAVIHNESRVSAAFLDVPAGDHRIHLWRIDDNVVVQGLAVRQWTAKAD